MSLIRKTRTGQKLVGSTIYVPEKVDGKYKQKAKREGKSKSAAFVATLVEHQP